MWLDAGRRQIALVVAHADDETIGAGAHLKYCRDLAIVHVTDGAPRDGADALREGFTDWRDYAAERKRELDAALERGEATHARRFALDIPDKQVVQNLRSFCDRLERIFNGFQPEIVITHAYEGGHPDHDACAFGCRTALPQRATLFEFAGYHLRDGEMRTGEFSPGGPTPEMHEIAGADLARKRAMLACFKTQREILSNFRAEIESFRIAPAYDFDCPPQEGPLLYETWGWPRELPVWG